MATWPPLTIDYKEIQQNKKSLREVLEGKFSVLIIKNFYDVNSCKQIVERITSQIEHQDTVSKKIGVSLVSYVNRKTDYFTQADAIRKTLRELFSGLDDPRKKIHELLGQFFPHKQITIAVENGKKYACGVIRIHEFGDSALIHRDSVRFEAKEFSVSKFPLQLSTVLYLQQSEKGGELVLYKKPWKKSDERFRNIDFGYKRDVVVNSTQYAKIKPDPGDLVIINPINYHEILPVKGSRRRITLGLFLAFSEHGKKVMTWS